MKRRSFIKGSLGAFLMPEELLLSSQFLHDQSSNSNETGEFEEILDGLWLIRDTCNVYLIKERERAIAIDFGSGKWLPKIAQLGITSLDHVFLTHHHRDQCAGLENQSSFDFKIHAPAGEQDFLDPAARGKVIVTNRFGRGCPISYSIPEKGIKNVLYDMNGFDYLFWEKKRIRFLKTPGHGPNACSVILDHHNKQIVFCGDAAYEGGKIWHPFNLEWDHWTGKGVLAAWSGLKQLSDVGMDLLCPSHGAVIDKNPESILSDLTGRLMDFYNTKNAISPGEKDLYLEPQDALIEGKVKRMLPSLYQYGNFYLLVSSTGEGMVIDLWNGDMDVFNDLVSALKGIKITAATASHYHLDHCDAFNQIRNTDHTRIVLHPEVAEPLRDVDNSYVPWLPAESIVPDELWPMSGAWNWNEYNFQIGHAPGQTWWHTVFMTTVDGKKVCFTGDSFQPNTRWNGTGGFCAYNVSRFSNGFVQSSKLIQQWDPDILASGHSSFFQYKRSKFDKIIEWANHTEQTIWKLCPEYDVLKHYYSLGVDSVSDLVHHPDVSLLKNELFAWYK